MRRSRGRWLDTALVPAIVLGAAVLAYFSWQSATRFAQLGEETIVQSTLLLIREKVQQLEERIIRADHAALRIADPGAPALMPERWREARPDLPESVRAVALFDADDALLGFVARASRAERRALRRLLTRQVVRDLREQAGPLGVLKHLHRTYEGRSRLFSYRVVRHRGRRFLQVVYHDPYVIVRRMLPELFATEEARRLYNVEDAKGRRIWGPSLAHAGDYVVGHRFPTTLYEWRLQGAPRLARQLDAQDRSQRMLQLGLVGTALVVVVLGLVFLLYALRKERRVHELQSEFVANVSHELKTPLSVIRMFAEMLTSGRVRHPDKQRQYLEIVQRESERLSALIENVLDFAALEQGRVRYHLAPGDVGAAVERAVDTFKLRLEDAEEKVRLRIAAPLSPVRLDPDALLLAVVNLLDNAHKYGAPPFDVSVEPAGDHVLVRVRDHGEGIPKDELKRVFERFYRGRRSREARGSGIGLAVVQHVARSHGGRVWAENAPDGGARFVLSLPVDDAPAEADEANASPGREERKPVIPAPS